ncbi:MAG TPA: TonB family protein [Polyangium sp.]|nr:TonB family protein [Polyangium sp.]
MFESAMGRSEASSSRLGTGAILSGVVHAFFAALVFIVPGKTKAQQQEPEKDLVVQIMAPKPAGGPAAPSPPAAQPKPQPRPPKPTPVIPKEPQPEPVDQPETPSQQPDPAPGSDSTANTGTGEPGNTGGGTGEGPGGPGPAKEETPPEKPTYTELNWNSKMERPVLISGPAQPEYPRGAMLQHREGTVLARCLIATDGAVRNCSIMSGDVMLQDAALAAVAQQRYRPMYYGGVPVSVWYVFRFTFKLQ